MAARTLTLSSPPVGATGVATVTIKTNGVDTWTLSQVSVEMTPSSAAPSGSTCTFRKNTYLVTPLIPTGDVADGSPPVILLPTDQATVTWTGCSVGGIGKVTVFLDDGR